MAFSRAIIGTMSIIVALLSAGIPDAEACDGRRCHHRYDQGYYGGYEEWNAPYDNTRSVPRHSRTQWRPSQRGNGIEMPGFRCYYRGKDGACMNYSYRHSSTWAGYSSVWDKPYVNDYYEPYEYAHSHGYGVDYQYSPYGNDGYDW
ncbi:hypothetical protein FJZ27_04540 [Candidatus Peribacteria bacterium]|nr:hypothetical protein [Candidatus Peribacteria bacterium]